MIDITMGNVIIEVARDLASINTMIDNYQNTGVLSFDEAWGFLQFYRTYKDTHLLINNAEELAHQDINLLYECAEKLASSSYEFVSNYEDRESELGTIDFESICKLHLQPYDIAWRTVSEQAREIRVKARTISNQLDYMDTATEEYAILDKECDALTAEYHKKEAEYKHLFDIYDKELRRISGLFCFDMALINILVNKLHSIATSIMRDVANIRKEGHV